MALQGARHVALKKQNLPTAQRMITAHRAPIRGRARPRRRCKCEEETLAISGIRFYNFLPAAICFRSSFRVRLAVLKSGPRNLKARDLLNAFLENTFPAVLKRGRLTVPISGPKNVRRIRKSQIPNQNFSHKASTCCPHARAAYTRETQPQITEVLPDGIAKATRAATPATRLASGRAW